MGGRVCLQSRLTRALFGRFALTFQAVGSRLPTDTPGPRPHFNTTPEERVAAHRARARHIGVLHSMDGCVVRTLGSGSRFPLEFDVIIIVAASRSGGVQPPPGDRIKHGFV